MGAPLVSASATPDQNQAGPSPAPFPPPPVLAWNPLFSWRNNAPATRTSVVCAVRYFRKIFSNRPAGLGTCGTADKNTCATGIRATACGPGEASLGDSSCKPSNPPIPTTPTTIQGCRNRSRSRRLIRAMSRLKSPRADSTSAMKARQLWVNPPNPATVSRSTRSSVTTRTSP